MKAFQAGAILPTITVILAFGAADALAREWVVVEQLGTVLQLTDDSWKEVERGSRFVDGVVIRTLQRGQLRLEAGSDGINIGRETVVEVQSSPGSESTSITQHAGSVTLAVNSAEPALQLLAPGLSVAPSAGVVVVRVDGDTTQVTVADGGEAVVIDRDSGRSVAVASGGAVTGSGVGGMNLAETPPTQRGSLSGLRPGTPSDGGAGLGSGDRVPPAGRVVQAVPAEEMAAVAAILVAAAVQAAPLVVAIPAATQVAILVVAAVRLQVRAAAIREAVADRGAADG